MSVPRTPNHIPCHSPGKPSRCCAPWIRVRPMNWCSAPSRVVRLATGIARRRSCKRRAARRAGPATICGAPARRCSGEMGELPDIIEAALNHVIDPLAAGRDLQPEPVPAAGRRGAATSGRRAGRDRSGGGQGGAAARWGLTRRSTVPACHPPFTLDSQRLGDLPQVTGKMD